jgi:hypothetical protein
LFFPSRCNRGRQRFCVKEDCRKASKAASQRQWSQQPQNADYFRGAAHVERVRQWRAQNPGCARRKKREAPLQDFAPPQAPAAEPLATMRSLLPSDFFQKEPEDLAPSGAPAAALQDFALIQDPLFVGLISMLAGAPLQESLAPLTRRLGEQGRRVLAQNPNVLGSRECRTAAHLNSC